LLERKAVLIIFLQLFGGIMMGKHKKIFSEYYNDNDREELYDTLDALHVLMEGDREFRYGDLLLEMDQINKH